MTRSEYINHLMDILNYDSMIETLSIASRYWLHREIIANNSNVLDEAIVREATPDILGISQLLVEKKWTRPELRYNSDRVLEAYNKDGQWISFKLTDYV